MPDQKQPSNSNQPSGFSKDSFFTPVPPRQEPVNYQSPPDQQYPPQGQNPPQPSIPYYPQPQAQNVFAYKVKIKSSSKLVNGEAFIAINLDPAETYITINGKKNRSFLGQLCIFILVLLFLIAGMILVSMLLRLPTIGVFVIIPSILVTSPLCKIATQISIDKSEIYNVNVKNKWVDFSTKSSAYFKFEAESREQAEQIAANLIYAAKRQI